GLDHRTGGDDAVVKRVLGAVDLHRLAVDERAVAVDLGDLVLLHEEVDALDDAVRHLTAAVERGPVVERDVPGDSEGLAVAQNGVRELGVAEQRLGGDTAHVEAYATPVFLLDDGHLEAELRGADCGDVATGARAEDDEIEMSVSHDTQGMRIWRARHTVRAGRHPKWTDAARSGEEGAASAPQLSFRRGCPGRT